MLLGIKSKKSLFFRHLLVGSFSLLLVYLFYLSYGAWGVKPAVWPDWGADHPFWRSWAHAAFVLLFLTLVLGPAAKLWRPFTRLLTWRRELGIWFALLGIGHAWAIWDRWAQQDVAALFGIQKMEEMGGYVLARPEVGIMNMMLLMLAPMVILLAVTSSDRAVNFLGISSWKWLHNSLIHAIFYIVMLRGILYLFFFFQYSPPNWKAYPSIWFLYPFLGMGVFAVLLQAAAFAKTVIKQRSYGQANSVLSVIFVIFLAVLFAMPMTLAAGTVLYFDGRLVQGNQAGAGTGNTQPAGNYAKTFYMVIRDRGQDIHIWVRDLDSQPFFRQKVEVSGKTVSEQIYRADQKALYSAEQAANGQLTWRKQDNVNPESIGVSNIAAGPGAWAVQYGAGEHQIRLNQGTVQVTIHSVGEAIDDGVFKIPEEVTQEPVKP